MKVFMDCVVFKCRHRTHQKTTSARADREYKGRFEQVVPYCLNKYELLTLSSRLLSLLNKL